MEKRLRTTRGSIWTRCGTELGWSDPTSLPRKPWRSLQPNKSKWASIRSVLRRRAEREFGGSQWRGEELLSSASFSAVSSPCGERRSQEYGEMNDRMRNVTLKKTLDQAA